MFTQLASINSQAIAGARRGKAVEALYADLIGTVALKFASNAGANNLLLTAIRATQTVNVAGYIKDPAPGTIKSDLLAVLREIEKAPSKALLRPRNAELTIAERREAALAFANDCVSNFHAKRLANPRR